MEKFPAYADFRARPGDTFTWEEVHAITTELVRSIALLSDVLHGKRVVYSEGETDR